MTGKKKEKTNKHFIRLREGIPYKIRKLTGGVKLVNKYDKAGFRVDDPVEIPKELSEKLIIRDKRKRVNGGLPEFEFITKEA